MYNREFKEIKKHLAFGLMRLPMKDDKIDNEQVCRMVDLFIDSGFNYFDTAHGYHDGLSEVAVKECLTSRYERSEYLRKVFAELFTKRCKKATKRRKVCYLCQKENLNQTKR